MVTIDNDGDAYSKETESTDEGDRTFVLLDVSDFTGKVESVGGGGLYEMKLRSYLRLGAVPSDIKAQYEAGTAFSKGDADGEDLASQVTSFVDDTRYRGSASDTYYRLDTDERVAETALLHTRGGWRDHTDGNRITTTRGDKVEVVVGNYKQVVMGRRQWESGASWDSTDASLHWESSGGVSYHYDQVPGQIVEVTWVDDAGIFRVKEESQKAHVVNRYEGTLKEWHYGDIVERVGSRAAYILATNEDGDVASAYPLPDEFDPENPVTDTNSDGYEDNSNFDKEDDESHTAAVAWPPDDDYEGIFEDAEDMHGYVPDVVATTFAESITEQTWARRIIDKQGSSSKKVPKIIDHDYADRIERTVNAGHIEETTDISGSYTSRMYDDGSGQGRIVKRSGRYRGYFAGVAGQFWGLGMSGDYRMTNFREWFVSGFESIRMGSSITLFAGVDIQGLALGLQLNVFAGVWWFIELFYGRRTTIALGIEHYSGTQSSQDDLTPVNCRNSVWEWDNAPANLKG